MATEFGQLRFDFGPEHPKNAKRVQRNTYFGLVRHMVPLSIAEEICGVQPMTTAGSFLTMKVVNPYIPPPNIFELTEPFSEHDMVEGCFGSNLGRARWERASECRQEGCCHGHN